MAHELNRSAPTVVTLASTRNILQVDGAPCGGKWLIITWPSGFAGTSLVRLESGGADGGALGTHFETYAPGTTGRVMVPVEGWGSIGVSGSSAFAVSLRVVQ